MKQLSKPESIYMLIDLMNLDLKMPEVAPSRNMLPVVV
jgi:hypothetical protein